MEKRRFRAIPLTLCYGKRTRYHNFLLTGIAFFLLFASLPVQLFSQEVPFRARFWDKNGVFGGILGGRILGGGSFITDSNGEISLLVNEGSEVQMVLTSEEWKIVYPREGIVPIPRDSLAFAQVIVARAGESDQSTVLIRQIEQLQSAVSGSDAAVKSEIQQLRDSLSMIFDQKTLKAVEEQITLYNQIRQENETRDSLLREETIIVITKGRLETLGILTPAIDHYITRTEDLRDTFKFNGRKSFNNGWVVGEINGKITAYNEAYEELNRNKNKILDLTEEFWKGKEDYKKVSKTEQLLEYALDEVHKMTTLSSNNLINDITNYRDARVKKKHKRARKEIISDMERFVYDLSNRLTTLIDRKSEVFQLLNEK